MPLSLSNNMNMVDVELLMIEVKWLASDYRVIAIGFSLFWKPNPKNNTPRERLLITKISFSRNYPLITWLPFPWLGADFHQHIVVSTNWYYIDTKTAICLRSESACVSQAESIAFETRTNLQGVRLGYGYAKWIRLLWYSWDDLLFLVSWIFRWLWGNAEFTLSLALHQKCSSRFPRPALQGFLISM